jgi:hypothetical protein
VQGVSHLTCLARPNKGGVPETYAEQSFVIEFAELAVAPQPNRENR